jgi:hypothetical protein
LYKGKQVGEDRVRAWLNQFGEATDQRIMFTLLENLRFYSSTNVRAKLREAHGIVIREIASRGIVRQDRGGQKRADNVLITYLGQAGKSGPHYVRLYADENRIYINRIVDPHTLRAALAEVEDLHGLVIVDDFVGTGTQASASLHRIFTDAGEVLQERGITVFLTCVSGFANAAEAIEAAMPGTSSLVVHLCDPLSESDRCFSPTSTVFDNAIDRQRAQEIATRIGLRLEKRHPLGYGDCQSLVIFEYNCPNNTLPILWKQTDDWAALFPR